VADLPEPWKGVLWFGFYAVLGFGVAWGIRRQLIAGRTPKHSSRRQQRFALYGFALVGLVGLALAMSEVLRWLA